MIHTTGIAGQSFTLNANGSNFGQFFVTLDDFDKRRDPEMHAFAITDRVREELLEKIPEANVGIFTPPPVSGLGTASGFKIIIEDRGDLGLDELQKQVDRLIAAGNAGRFKLTDKSFAALQETSKQVPEAVLAKLDAAEGSRISHQGIVRRRRSPTCLRQAEVKDQCGTRTT